MGTKRPSCTLFDTSSNINTSDRKLQPGGNVSRDPSPRPGLTAQSERERDGGREDDWRRERETEKMRDKARSKDMDPRDRHYDRDRAPAPRPRDGERDWRERERRHEDGSGRNGRPLSNVERETEREVDRRMRKGDTFPRIRKHSGERGRRLTATAEMVEERGEQRQRDRPKREELDDWERDREKARQREMQRLRERDEIRGRPKDERQNTGRRYAEDEKGRERYREFDAGFQDERREVGGSRDTARKREKPRPDLGQREARMPSPRRRRDREESEEAQRREDWRGTRSEGDSDEREMKRERQRERQREEMQYQHSRSEGDKRNPTQMERDRDRQGYREEDKHRYRERYKERDRERDEDRSRRWEDEKDRDRYREDQRRPAREADREKDRYKESTRDTKEDRRRHERYRDYKEGRVREAKEREEDPRLDDTTSRGRQSQSATFPREPPRAQSSGEWSTESDRDVDEQRSAAERKQREKKRSERHERDRGETAGSRHEQRRMWLEPQRGNNSKGDFVDRERETRERGMKSQAEWRREGQRGKEEPDESCWDQSSYGGRHRVGNEYRGDTERETEGVSVDAEEVGKACREMDKEGKGHLSGSDGGIEESDREEAGGSDYCAPSESEGGSDTGWKPGRDRILSGEDGFVTVSSGGDEEEQFEDCREFWEGGVAYDDPPAAALKRHEGGEKREEEWTAGKEEMGDESKPSKYIFCLIGQTLPRSETKGKSPSQVNQAKGVEIENPYDEVTWEPHADCSPALGSDDKYPVVNNQDAKSKGNISREEKAATGETTEEGIGLQSTETREGMKHKKENPYDEIGPIKRDSQTERLLIEWREKNKEEVKRRREPSLPLPSNPYPDIFSEVDFEQIQPILDGINTGAMSPEEVEAIRIRLSGAWSMSEEPKRHSQAPHLKWAKNVVREILGHSEEQSLTVDPNAEAVKNNTQQVEIAQETGEGPADELRMDEEHSDPELEEEEPLEVEGLRGMGQGRVNMHADQLTAMHDDAPTYTHDDTLLDTAGQKDPSMDRETDVSGRPQSGKTDIEVKISEAPSDELQLSEKEIEAIREKEVEMYLSVSNTLYKPSSCPLLSYETGSEPLIPSSEGEGQEVEDSVGESDEERQEEESGEGDTAEEEGSVEEGKETEIDSGDVAERKMKGGTLRSTCSFRDLGPKARLRRRGIRKTTERRNSKRVDVKEEEGVARDRRTRIFSTTDDEDDKSKSWGEVELRNVLDTIERRKRNSKFFNAAQLYQQYSEAAQNFEILRQARSDVISVVGGETTQSPAPSPPPARRPLPPLPQPVQHPQSLSHKGSITSVQSLPLPEPPRIEGRPSSPRLSISLSQSSTLWRELPAVRNSTELKELTEDERRLQEVRFEVVTSEASYCRSLDIVVEHFVKSKQLGALLGTQERNWLFSRLADVRAISHSFLSKLEERVESNTMSFTVCDIIARHCQRFRMVYVPYLTNQSYQDATYQRLMNENQRFKQIVEKLERSPVCQRLPFRSFLVLPFQRITRIKLLVQNIVKRTAPGTPEATQAIKALKLLEKLIQESNDSITQMKSIESLVSLSAKVDFECRTLPLVSQSRRLVREGPVTELMDFSLKDTERTIYMHLFNDYLLLSLQKDGGRFTVIDHSPVSELRVENCRVKLHSLQKNLFRLHMSHKALLLRTDTQGDKLRWISSLSRPHPEIDFSAAQDFPQMQCVRTFVAQQPDELSLEKADIILVHQQSSDNWVEGTKLSDRQRGWVKADFLETITNSRVCNRNLTDAQKLTTATAAV